MKTPMKTTTIRVAFAVVAMCAAVSSSATDIDDYRFRYDFSSGARKFYGSSKQTKDPLTNNGDAKDFGTPPPTLGPDGEGTAVHPTNTAWSAVGSSFGTALNANWTLAMSVRPGFTENGVIFSVGRKNESNRKSISICSSSDPTRLIVDENRHKNVLTERLYLDNGVDVSAGFHTVVVVYRKPVSGNAGILDFYVDGVFQKSHTTANIAFKEAFQFCTTVSGLTSGEVMTREDPNVAFRDVRFYDSAFSSADAKKYAALYPADTLRPSASIRAYGVNSVDTGYFVKPSTRIAADFQYTEVVEQARIFGESGALGCHLYINGYWVEFASLINDSATYSGSAFGSGEKGKANVSRAFVWIDRPAGKANLKQYKPSRNVNETLSGTCAETAETALTLPLFAEFSPSGTQRWSNAYIYSVDMQENGTPVHFFAPHNDATLGACFKDVITGELKGESMPNPSTALSYSDGFGSSSDYKYENGTLYAKVYAASASAVDGTVAVLSGGTQLVPEAEGFYWIAYGTELTLAAMPGSGYRFTGWVGDTRILKNGTAASAEITVAIDKVAQFEARFTPLERFHTSDGGYAASGERSAKLTDDPNDVDFVVMENACGFEGVEPHGAYMVNGSHAFSADTATSGVFEGTAIGYKLERWNRDSKTWEFVSYGGGNTFAYTNCAANGRMRLTWFWKQTGQVRKYGVNDYIQYDRQSDLLAHFDGILNAGANAAHETSPSEWVDLTGHFNLATNNAPTFIGDAWVADKASYFSASSDAVKNALAANAFTLEMMISHPGGQVKGSYEYWAYVGNDTSHRQFVVDLREKNSKNPLVQGVQYRESGWNSRSQLATGSITQWDKRQYIAVVCDLTGATTYCDGANQIHRTTGGSLNPDQSNIFIGAAWDASCPLVAGTEICAVRMTACALPAWQLEYNNAVDHVRFCGNVTVVNGAIGETEMKGESSAPDGVYDVASGTWTLTALDVFVDGKRYSPHLTVETLVDGKWVRTMRRWMKSYTVDKSVLGNSRIRLKWTWEASMGFTIIVR